MELGVVIGSVVATRKDPAFVGSLLLLVQTINHLGEKKGRPLVAVDPVGNAGPGDVIIYVHSPDAAMAFPGDIKAPTETAIVAIVDHVDIGQTTTIRTGQKWKWEELSEP